jgi:hypothetical protein
VSVFVIDCTTIGALPPMTTLPMCTATVWRALETGGREDMANAGSGQFWFPPMISHFNQRYIVTVSRV